MKTETNIDHKAHQAARLAHLRLRLSQAKTALARIEGDGLGYMRPRSQVLKERIKRYQEELRRLDPENLGNWVS